MSFLGLRPASRSLLGAVRTACSTTWPGMRTTFLSSTVAPAPAKISRASSSSTNTPVRSRTSRVPRWMSARSSSVSTRNSHAFAACAPRLMIPFHGRTSLLSVRWSGLHWTGRDIADLGERSPLVVGQTRAALLAGGERGPYRRRRRRRPRCGPRRSTARTAAASRCAARSARRRARGGASPSRAGSRRRCRPAPIESASRVSGVTSMPRAMRVAMAGDLRVHGDHAQAEGARRVEEAEASAADVGAGRHGGHHLEPLLVPGLDAQVLGVGGQPRVVHGDAQVVADLHRRRAHQRALQVAERHRGGAHVEDARGRSRRGWGRPAPPSGWR